MSSKGSSAGTALLKEVRMTVMAPPVISDPRSPPLIARVRAILVQPRSEWATIAAEPATVGGLYAGYILWLAALAPLASVIEASVFGIRLPYGGIYRVPVASAASSAVVRYAVALVITYVLALVIDALAPTFGGTRSPIRALKVAAYASTPSWVAGAFAAVPLLSGLELLGLYSLYLVFLALPAVMGAPRDRALGYAAAVIACAAVLFLVGGAVAARFVGFPLLSLPVR
ncbi:MAG: Yip1 family protein [bacterium]